ncbi:MAG TPA: GIY-YIG nuclease family protein [Candidatus Elarobacter sp.]|nr:GIY-YIG nuclease family protein [Candidatus Elarobacter sp.]
MRHYYVYMLRCGDGRYYVGVTSALETRVAQHQAGLDPWCYTFGRRPVQLVFSATFGTPDEAIFVEKRVKGWSRAKKEALIRGDWDAVRELARARCAAAAHPSTSSG